MKERLLRSFPVRVVKRYGAADGSVWSTSIAWNALFAFFPIILAAFTILGFLMRGSDLSASLERDISQTLPNDQGRLIIDALHSFRSAAGPLAVVSFVGLIWGGTSLFGAVDQGLDALYPVKKRGFVRQKLMSVAMILVFTVLLVPAAASSSLLSILDSFPGAPSFLTSGPLPFLLQIAFGILDGALLFSAVYYIVPNRKHAIASVLPGALVAGVLFEAFQLLFPLYFKLEHGFGTYGATFALFFLLMTFAYWLAQILMLGGAVNAELDPPRPGAWPQAGSSIDPDAQAQADEMHLRGQAEHRPEAAGQGVKEA